MLTNTVILCKYHDELSCLVVHSADQRSLWCRGREWEARCWVTLSCGSNLVGNREIEVHSFLEPEIVSCCVIGSLSAQHTHWKTYCQQHLALPEKESQILGQSGLK